MSLAYARQGEDCIEVCVVFENAETKPYVVQLSVGQSFLLAEQLLREANMLEQRRRLALP